MGKKLSGKIMKREKKQLHLQPLLRQVGSEEGSVSGEYVETEDKKI